MKNVSEIMFWWCLTYDAVYRIAQRLIPDIFMYTLDNILSSPCNLSNLHIEMVWFVATLRNHFLQFFVNCLVWPLEGEEGTVREFNKSSSHISQFFTFFTTTCFFVLLCL